MVQTPGHSMQKIFGGCRCSITVVFGVLVRLVWEHWISNTEVRRRVLEPKNVSVTEQLYNSQTSVAGTCIAHVGRPSSPASLVHRTQK